MATALSGCPKAAPSSSGAPATLDASDGSAGARAQPADAALTVAEPASRAPWAISYDEKSAPVFDDKRCADAGAARHPVRVKVVLGSSGGTLELIGPGIRKRLWQRTAGSPGSCSASRRSTEAHAVWLSCGEDLSSMSGKLFVSGSDLVAGIASPSGVTHERFALRCGADVDLAIVCPRGCESEAAGTDHESCACSLGPDPVMPQPSALPR